MEEMQLRVEDAYPIDLGRGIIRLDPATLLKLQLSPSDIVEIRGTKKTTAKVWRADRQDWDQGLVRIDNFIQQNAGVSIGEFVAIEKVKVPVAKKVVLAFMESIAPEVVEFQKQANDILKRFIIKRPVFKGDIIPIIYSVPDSSSEFEIESISQYLKKKQNSSRVITLVVVDTEPFDSIVQISEETEIELSDKVFRYSEVITPLTSSNIKGPSLTSSSIYITSGSALCNAIDSMQLLGSIKKDNDIEIDIITLSENIVKTKDHYEKIRSNIKEYNANYAVEDSIILTNLDDVVNKSDKIIYKYIYNLKLQDAFSYINDLDLQLETYHKAALSEIAHRKIKEIEFEINNPFFASRLRKDYKRLVSEFDKLDTAGIQGTKNTKEFIETSKSLMEKLQETEDDLEEEQKTGIRSTLKTIILWGIPALFSFYSLVAADYFTVDFYTPIIFYILLSGITYLLLKSGVNFKIIYLAYKNNIYEFKKSDLISVIPPMLIIIAAPYSILIDPPIITNSTNLKIFIYVFFVFLISLLIVIAILFSLKNFVKATKSNLIKKEIENLIKSYGLDTSVRP